MFRVLICVILSCFCGKTAFAQIEQHSESFSLPSDPEIVVQLKIKKDSKKNQKLPVIFILGGFQEAGKVLELIHSPKPALLVSFDYPYFAPRKFHFPESLKELPRVKRMIHRTLQSIPLVLTELLKREDVDPQKVTLIGASLGAPFMVMAAAEDARFQGLVVLQGFGKIRRTVQFQFEKKWKDRGIWGELLSSILAWIAWLYVDLDPVEELAHQLRSHQKVLLIHSENDEFIPEESKKALVEGVKKSSAVLTEQVMKGGHLSPGADAMIQEMLRRVDEWMVKYQLW